ncbi:MAG: DUF3486 family protein [Sandarakinorhabdus sp.]|nr:DUF3486 family protein [Sandarakinorhabdus sp.]
MARRVKSSIDRLSPERRQTILELRLAHGRTIDEIQQHLEEAGETGITRSALARHLQKIEDDHEERARQQLAMLSPAMQFANSLSAAMVEKIEAGETDNKLRATRELMQSKIFKWTLDSMNATPEHPQGERLPKELFIMARTMQTLEQAARTFAQREREARQEEREIAVKKVEEVARKSGGLTAETVAQIRFAVLGDA